MKLKDKIWDDRMNKYSDKIIKYQEEAIEKWKNEIKKEYEYNIKLLINKFNITKTIIDKNKKYFLTWKEWDELSDIFISELEKLIK